MKLLGWIIPGLIVFAIFYFGKLSDDKCKQIAIEKMAGFNLKPAPVEILVDDKLVLKTILYIRNRDTINIGNGMS